MCQGVPATCVPSPLISGVLFFVKLSLILALYVVVVTVTTSHIPLNNEKGLVPRFILTVTGVIVPTLWYVYNVQTRRTALAFLYMQVSCWLSFVL